MNEKIVRVLLILLVALVGTALLYGSVIGFHAWRTVVKIEKNIDNLDRSIETANRLITVIEELKPVLADTSKFMVSVKDAKEKGLKNIIKDAWKGQKE